MRIVDGFKAVQIENAQGHLGIGPQSVPGRLFKTFGK